MPSSSSRSLRLTILGHKVFHIWVVWATKVLSFAEEAPLSVASFLFLGFNKLYFLDSRDGVRRYKTMTPLSTFGAVLAGASTIGLVAVAMKRPKRKS